MIESREKRRARSLLRRRKIIIVVALAVLAVLSLSCWLLYTHLNTTVPFKDADGVTYYAKLVDGKWGMYDKAGNLLSTTTPPGTKNIYYVTEWGTTLSLDENGTIKVKSIPDLDHYEDGENLDHEMLSVHKGIESKDVRKIEVHNQNGSYTILRLSDDGSDFVLAESPISALNRDRLSYLVYYSAHTLVSGRLSNPIKDTNGNYSEYGLVPEKRIDAQGNEYDYNPTTYTVTAKTGETHTMIIGDKLIDGSAYYAQYKNSNGELRDAVYIFQPSDMSSINGSTFENTLLAHPKDLIDPYIVYPSTSTDYFDVREFTIKTKNESEVISFSYVDLADRTGTVLGIHPYVFTSASAFSTYNPNYDRIDVALRALMDPSIVGVEVLSPSNADKAKYGLMKEKLDENGDPVLDQNGKKRYVYDAKYTVSFKKTIIDEVSGEEQEVLQTIYISAPTESGTYYSFTEMRFVDAPADAAIKGVGFDTICEVAPATYNFLTWTDYDWIYPVFMQIGITYTDKVELIASNNYSATFNIHSKSDADSALTVDATNSLGETVSTFGTLAFKDLYGQRWTITSTRVKLMSADGKTELKPVDANGNNMRSFVYNSIGEQVHVIDPSYSIVTENGDHVYVSADYVTIKYAGGNTVEHLRYHSTIFKKVFASINSTAIVDAYPLSKEEEQELISNPDNFILTLKITDCNGTLHTYDFYSLTARKSYILVDGVGGFFVPATKMTKLINDTKKFFAGIDVDYTAHN